MLNGVTPRCGFAGLAEGDQRRQDLGNAAAAGAGEMGSDLIGCGRRALGGEHGAHRLELLRQLSRPGLPCRLRCSRNLQIALYRRRTDAGLKFRAQPTDLAKPLLVGAFAIEGDEPSEEIVIGEIGGPAIGGEHRAVEITPTRPRS
jgi:hypothetical protein